MHRRGYYGRGPFYGRPFYGGYYPAFPYWGGWGYRPWVAYPYYNPVLWR